MKCDHDRGDFSPYYEEMVRQSRTGLIPWTIDV